MPCQTGQGSLTDYERDGFRAWRETVGPALFGRAQTLVRYDKELGMSYRATSSCPSGEQVKGNLARKEGLSASPRKGRSAFDDGLASPLGQKIPEAWRGFRNEKRCQRKPVGQLPHGLSGGKTLHQRGS